MSVDGVDEGNTAMALREALGKKSLFQKNLVKYDVLDLKDTLAQAERYLFCWFKPF